MPLGTEVGLGPGDFVLDGDPAPPSPKKGTQHPHTFRPISIVAKRSPISAIAELLFDFQDGGRPSCACFVLPAKSIWWFLSVCKI